GALEIARIAIGRVLGGGAARLGHEPISSVGVVVPSGSGRKQVSAIGGLRALHQPRRIAGHQVDLEIDRVAGAEPAERRGLERMRMISTENASPATSLMVSDTPSSATEPFVAM